MSSWTCQPISDSFDNDGSPAAVLSNLAAWLIRCCEDRPSSNREFGSGLHPTRDDAQKTTTKSLPMSRSLPIGASEMSLNVVAERAFVAADQERFAAVCGDRNPIHMDPVAARRTFAGFPVVHGIHALLWALDSLFRYLPKLAPVASIRVSFEKLIYVGDRVQVVLAHHDKQRLRVEILVEGIRALRLEVALGDPRSTLRQQDRTNRCFSRPSRSSSRLSRWSTVMGGFRSSLSQTQSVGCSPLLPMRWASKGWRLSPAPHSSLAWSAPASIPSIAD